LLPTHPLPGSAAQRKQAAARWPWLAVGQPWGSRSAALLTEHREVPDPLFGALDT